MADNNPRGLLQSVLGFFARKRPESSAQPGSLSSRTREAWLRTDAYLQHDADELDEVEPDRLARTLRVLEEYVQYDSDREPDCSLRRDMPYPKLQAMRSIIERPSHDSHSSPGTTIRVSKRRRESDAVIQELSYLYNEGKRRRVLRREEPTTCENSEDPEADFAVLMRKHLVSLDNALRRDWVCVCHNCSGLSVRLSLPQHEKGLKLDTCFEVFFGVRSLLAIELQEARITVKSTSDPLKSGASNFTHICQSITGSLGQANCLNLALEDGRFRELHPQPKTFGSNQMAGTVSLSTLFKRQQELRGGSSALPLKGKRILAVTLATALLPFLETPWLQPSFNHSKIQFFEPLQSGELPDITKPFLAMEHIPILSARNEDTGVGSGKSKHMVHPNASVLALGILLCELHYCTPVELMQKESGAARNVNTDYYTSLEMLKSLEVEVGVDYYLAIKACLQWEYYPPGQQADFESVSVQRLFYQNVVKRLEAEISKSWGLRLEDLGSFESRANELCWGSIGREVFRHQTGKADPSDTNNQIQTISYRSIPDVTPVSHISFNPDMGLQMPTHPSLKPQSSAGPFVALPEKSFYFFDASHQAGCEQASQLSRQWMDRLLYSINQHVDPYQSNKAERRFEPVRIAILDSGFDPDNPLLRAEDGRLDPRIKAAQSFIAETEPNDIRDEIGHGTHALGLLLKVATCAEIYIARIAHRETLDLSEWKVDIISMSFGIRELSQPIKTAVSDAIHSQTLLFSAASNDGANFGRAFPAKFPGVFCIHSTDGNGNPSMFNPTADDKDVNFSLLGEHVSSHWLVGKDDHDQPVKVMSGTSVATPIAAGLAASVLSFVRQQDSLTNPGNELLGPWLQGADSMDAVLKSMARHTRGAGYDYLTPHVLFDRSSTREHVYEKIKDIKKRMYT
ncbi:S8/S53 family peptidase [Aspergillus homomorphus CBS 101889]|uniref:Subtilisin-like protein n=1 Tax=Aspergillus homomorphus (strain CBS 101889) TaxID=1450537 RepID=A0A395HIG7_ASPHC|nr:subtilisin-like protein [Aspergillus homomorphus CBS 101889]RAL07701.1 subtilisin-like protein [Aspergillus homomorphus CBS 101889]